MNKKGEVTDYLIFVITLFVFAIGLFILIYTIPAITGGLKHAGLNNTAETSNAIRSIDNLSNVVNRGFAMLFVGLVLSMFITSFMTRSHPIFLFLYIIFLGISVILSAYLTNAYQIMIENPTFSSVLANATYITWIMQHSVQILVVVGAVSMIITFAKFNDLGGIQGGF